MKANKKIRLDLLLVERNLAESRNAAQRLIMARDVIVNGQMAFKPSQFFDKNCIIELRSKPLYVSRGGYKLEKALQAFKLLDLDRKVCVDIGASTGGFTDCLLKHNAAKVYAVDVGYGQLHSNLRNHPKVVVMERKNVRDITGFPESIDLVTIDASFISVKLILPIIKLWTKNFPFIVIALVKPQFEAGRKVAAKTKGVIKDEAIRFGILEDVMNFANNESFVNMKFVDSPILGPKGNREILLYLELLKANPA